jgi:hypothetical protein
VADDSRGRSWLAWGSRSNSGVPSTVPLSSVIVRTRAGNICWNTWAADAPYEPPTRLTWPWPSAVRTCATSWAAIAEV